MELLVQQLPSYEEDQVSFYLVDVSHALLVGGYQHACERVGAMVPVVAIEGDFRTLPTFMHYFSPQGPRRKLITMLGYTVGNLINEIAFFRESLDGCACGDLLLLDFGARRDSKEDEAAIRALLSGRQHHQLSFLLNPLTRIYGEHAIRVQTRIETSCPIENSYAVEIEATVTTPTETKTFQAASWRGYDPASFALAMREVGWEQVDSWVGNEQQRSVLALFRRR